ncbi:unnamed protein product [marine sediment metagenome]|uniref:Uncharacterized protein n=1 Tax=marine sediment metagenome TaxID=412755 RepID=X1G180_9ZZZZ
MDSTRCSESMNIRIFVTGGTFDKEYNELTGELFFKDTHLPQMLTLGRCRVTVDIRTLMMIDSREITDEDRETITSLFVLLGIIPVKITTIHDNIDAMW